MKKLKYQIPDKSVTMPDSVPGDYVLDILSKMETKGKVAAFIRHSEREDGPSEAANQPLESTRKLTERGISLAIRFGELLPSFHRMQLTHTVMPRSRETASFIMRGYQTTHPDGEILLQGDDPTLGIARYYAIDTIRRLKLREQLGATGFIRAWLCNEISTSIMPPVRQVVKSFISGVQANLEGAPRSTLHLMVGHDVELIVLRDSIFNSPFKSLPWIGFLDGLIFSWNSATSLDVYWRDIAVHSYSP